MSLFDIRDIDPTDIRDGYKIEDLPNLSEEKEIDDRLSVIQIIAMREDDL